MSFRLGVLFRVTGGLARGETLRRTIEFVVMGHERDSRYQGVVRCDRR